jgi:hypothetical protein
VISTRGQFSCVADRLQVAAHAGLIGDDGAQTIRMHRHSAQDILAKVAPRTRRPPSGRPMTRHTTGCSGWIRRPHQRLASRAIEVDAQQIVDHTSRLAATLSINTFVKNQRRSAVDRPDDVVAAALLVRHVTSGR